MPVVEDRLWKNPGNPGMIVVTSHASVMEDGKLYLGYGEAQEAIKRIPDIEYECGHMVINQAPDGVYGFLPVRPSKPAQRIIGFGLFQTQRSLEEEADPDLIRYSMECLRHFVAEHADLKIRMNFPGVGEGGLSVDEVAPLLLPIPPTITVCHHGEVQRSMPTNFTDFKTIYLQVEDMLLNGRSDIAAEYLVNHGFDIQSAVEQVNAVERMIRERREREADHVRKWRHSRLSDRSSRPY